MTFMDDFCGILLVLSFTRESKGVFRFAIRNLVNSVKEGIVATIKAASKATHTGTIHLLPELTQGDVFPHLLYHSV